MEPSETFHKGKHSPGVSYPNVNFDSYLGCLDADRFIYIAGFSSHVTVIKILQKSLSNDETYLDWIGLDPFQVY